MASDWVWKKHKVSGTDEAWWPEHRQNGPVVIVRRGIPQARRRYLSHSLRLAVISRDHWHCRYCGQRITNKTANIDHVTPWRKGGKTELSNLVVCCKPCNKRKGNQVWIPLPIKSYPA